MTCNPRTLGWLDYVMRREYNAPKDWYGAGQYLKGWTDAKRFGVQFPETFKESPIT